MKTRLFMVVVLAFLLTLFLPPMAAFAQLQGGNAAVASAPTAPPPVIQFSGAAGENGTPFTGTVNMTFTLYAAQQNGEPLWTETQSVELDGAGHYSVQLGITKPGGVPAPLFASGEARWLGVRIAGLEELPRILLVSVPYALKAGDAATLGGLPPSAFLLAASGNTNAAAMASSAGAEAVTPETNPAVTGTGTVDYLPMWDSASDIIDSVLFQSGTGATARIGIGTTTPTSTLDVKGNATIRGGTSILGTLAMPATGAATTAAGRTSEPMTATASAYNSTSKAAVNQTFQWQAEPAGNDTASPSATLNFLFGSGTTKPAETGLSISSNGQITFAAGQTFPGGGGGGTVTSVGSGAGLTGGPITDSGTLSIATGGVTNAMLANSELTVGPGTGLTGGGAVALGGSTTLNVDTTKIPQLFRSPLNANAIVEHP